MKTIHRSGFYAITLIILLSGHVFLAKAQKIAGTDVIIDASDFIDDIPRLHQIHTARSLGVEWLYNNFAIQMITKAGFSNSNYMKDVVIPGNGAYYLYVRSVGGKGTFRLRINDRYVEHVFGSEEGAVLVKAGEYAFKKGEKVHLTITRGVRAPSLDVIVFSKNPNLTEADLKDRQLPDEVALLHEYDIPASRCVKFGDLTGDGKTDFVVLGDDYSIFAFDNGGKELWRWIAPEDGKAARETEDEVPGAVWDFDRDGKAEYVGWREFDGKERLVVSDGITGAVRAATEWPTRAKPHPYNNFRIAIGNLDGKYPNAIVVFTDDGAGLSVNAYSPELNLLWSYAGKLRKDHLGHYVFPYDFNGDGIDEVLCGYLLFDNKGNIIWERLSDMFDNNDHADSYNFSDLDGDGKPEIISSTSSLGTQAREAMTGKLIWEAPSEHNQKLRVGKFLEGYDHPQVVAGARVYRDRTVDPYIAMQAYWFDHTGKLIKRWPANELNGNPDFTSGDWYGNGTEKLFWGRFMFLPDGRGKLYFTDDVYHGFDFERNGNFQVITLDRTKLRVWGYKHAKARQPNNNPDFLRQTMSNHTHY
jgi:hypothetical protein